MAGIAILDYDPTWPDQFEQLAAALWRHLGDTVMGIDHIGSTAVPGLAAKDVIDLQVTVADLADADRLAPAFQRAGYVATPYRLDHRPAGEVSDPGLWEKRLWQSASGAGRRVNVHVRVAGWPNQRYALLFPTACGPIHEPPRPTRGSSVSWPAASVTTWRPTPRSRIQPATSSLSQPRTGSPPAAPGWRRR